MNSPKVSVVIPNYNYAKYISTTIESVLAQTYSNYEVIVVDDGSTDESLAILQGFGDKIRILKQQNQGVSVARNHGVANSTGEFIAFLDADDIWHAEKLERQAAKFFGDKEIGLVHCSMTLIDPHNNVVGENRNGKEGWLAEDLLKFEEGAVIGAGSTGLVRREVFNDVGGFDPNCSTAADWDFCYRVSTKHKIGFVSDPLVLYRIHSSNMHTNIQLMEHDMLIGYEKAFANGAAVNKRLCYGNLHRTLAGSYFYAGQYAAFIRHFAKSIWNRPSNLAHFAKFPIRQIRNR